jgi:hypothetical protein
VRIAGMKFIVYGDEARVAVQNTEGLFDAADATAAYAGTGPNRTRPSVPSRLIELIKRERPALELLETVGEWVRTERPDMLFGTASPSTWLTCHETSPCFRGT